MVVELVENDFNVVKRNSLITINEVSVDMYISTSSLIATDSSYIEVYQND